MAAKDYYKILELTDEDRKLQGDDFLKKVKSNYKSMAKRFHPDKFANKSDEEKNAAEEKFKEITEAYSVLSDEKKRRQYDRFGTADDFDFNGFGGTGMPDIDEILNRFRSGFSPFGGGFNPFGGGFGFNRGNNQSQKPQPLKVRVHVTVEDLYKGDAKTIQYKRFVPCTECGGNGTNDGGKVEVCPVCGGSGYTVQTESNGWAVVQHTTTCQNCSGTGHIVTNPCKKCGGSGRVVVTENFEIKIPEGAMDGSVFVVNGMGNCAERNPDLVGDLYVIIAIDGDGKYKTNGCDLYTTIEVPVLECLTGGKAELELFDGKKINITIPRFTRDGKVLQIQGYGLPTGNGRGKLLIEVRHKYPKDISSSEEKLLKQLKQSKNFK